MAKKSTQLRPIIKLRSTAGTGYTYVTRKNRRNTPGSSRPQKIRSHRASPR